jgi:hypothetical protein
MSNTFFETIKTLFPRSRAFQLFIDNFKRRMIEALAKLPESIRILAELVYLDLFPDTTRFPEKWEKTFAVYFTASELPKRRNILDSLWKINNGGQAAEYLQGVLQGIEIAIRVVENVPVSDPRSIRAVRLAVCGNRIMVCGNRKAVCDYRLDNTPFIPSVLRNDVSEFYTLPYDRNYWEMCFFVCKEVVRDGRNNIIFVRQLTMNIIWKNYIEYLILKIKPVHSAAIVFINWVEED